MTFKILMENKTNKIAENLEDLGFTINISNELEIDYPDDEKNIDGENCHIFTKDELFRKE